MRVDHQEFLPAGYRELGWTDHRERAKAQGPKFSLEPWNEIAFAGGEEWGIKRFLPRRGLAAIYGRPGSLKSFVAVHLALSVALGQPWGGRKVSQSPVVYIAAEGASGLRKRKAGYERGWPGLADNLPFYLISTAPNLGTEAGDLKVLIADIDAAGVSPGMIVLDTLAQTMGSADENGSGMTAFAANALALSQRFNALVLVVHHTGLGESAQQRMRGHSSLHGALDAQILCERKEGELSATLTLQKLKDEQSDVRLTATMSRVVIGVDEEGDEISTLIVDAIEDAQPAAEAPKAKVVPPPQRLLMAILTAAISDNGVTVKPFGESGPMVRALSDEIVRSKYYARIAEQAGPEEDQNKLAERQRRAFNRAIADTIKAQRVAAAEINGKRMLWLS